MAILECKGLCNSYGAEPALDRVDLSVEPGHIVGLLGPNGSGKSTLIKLANGLLTPDAGEILIDGMAPSKETKKIVSYLPERTYFADWMTALQLLAVLKRTGRTLTDLAGIMKKYPQVLVNVHSDNKAGLDDCQPIWDAVAAAEKELNGRGRILVRPSGTEPLVRVMAEAETHELTQRVVDDIVEVVKRELP